MFPIKKDLGRKKKYNLGCKKWEIGIQIESNHITYNLMLPFDHYSSFGWLKLR